MSDTTTEPASTSPVEAPESDETIEDTGQPDNGSEAKTGTDPGDQPEPRTYSAEAMAQVRDEAAKYRTRARTAEQRAEQLAERLMETTVRSAASGVLADPADLLLHVEAAELVDDDGLPDPDKIVHAARGLTASKPHLADRRPTAPIDQGARGEPQPFSLADALRQRAG